MRTENVEKLKSQVNEIKSKLSQLSDAAMQKVLGSGLWSGKEILGHMSDSATINRQRIVRSQYENLYEFPMYEQAQWVRIQSYKNYPWADLVSLCVSEYQHLIHILENLPDQSASDRCPVKFSSSEFVTLDWLVGHMYRHNDHHLHQILWLVGKSELPDERVLNQPIEALPN